ncbi:6-hydroxy-D-nicotine oxidase [Aaosphaeria arxii CBS 175.79]|uniref:6-hydroxy-D-nicotine oxidase n=1 Tax=Aaosphaeria arxii CBS 175.79 TaxID=1450172 RepID=A0A6A5XVR3_9PLEO|nr:6-hydroxy-D-nicotine oxidase [Aaosphaeria arxii CBS 175.79]KAF2017049.1 6-hydroxy-D-nicotine oxidase [Aaosphaeria arxii CBS 175.79]
MFSKTLFFLAGATQVAAEYASCCQALKNELPAQVFTTNETGYIELNTQRWSNTSILAPSCVFEPQSAEDVSKGVQTLAAGSCPFSIKSGGHNPIPGANNIDGGVSIVLGALNEIELDEETLVVHLGPGARWGQVYEKFSGEGNSTDPALLVPGGLCGGTGIGGVSTGGGESYLLSSHGWVVDNVVNYQVVLASGEIVDANQESNPDLFRALKGATNNFGIVTRVDVQAIDQPQIWGGAILAPYMPDTAYATLDALTNFTEIANTEPSNGAQVIVTYTATGQAIIALSIANVENVANATGLKPFTDIQPQIANTVGSRTLSSIVTELDTNQADGFRDTSATITFKNDPETLYAVHNASDQVYLKYNKTVDYLDFVLFYVPTSKIDGTHAALRGGNVLGLEDEEDDLMVAFITPRWLDEAQDAAMYQMAEEWVAATKAVTVEKGTDHPFLYQNFATPNQKPICGYGEENVNFLQAVSKKYDPEGVFQTLVPGGFKVSKAC